VVHFLLVCAVDLQRNSLVELEYRAAVQGGERQTVELECHGHHRPRRLAVVFLAHLRVARDLRDLRVLEDLGVELRGDFGLVVEPQARADSLRDFHVDTP